MGSIDQFEGFRYFVNNAERALKNAMKGPALALDLDRVLMAAQKTRSDADYETYMKKIEREIDGEQDQ